MLKKKKKEDSENPEGLNDVISENEYTNGQDHKLTGGG